MPEEFNIFKAPVRIDVAYNPGETFSMNTRWAFHFAFGFSF